MLTLASCGIHRTCSRRAGSGGSSMAYYSQSMALLYGLIAICLAAVPTVLGSSILVVSPFPAKSHVMLFEPLAIELANKRHQVTFITPHVPKKPVPNLTIIQLPLPTTREMPDLFSMRHFGPVQNALFLPFFGYKTCDDALHNEEVQKLLKTKPKFDVVIVETFLTEALAAGFAYHFKAPLIGYGTFMPSYWVNYWVGNIAPSSFIPDPFTNLPIKMDFLQRAYNFLFLMFANSYHYLNHILPHDKLLKTHFGADTPFVTDIIRNTSLLLNNDHFSTSFPRPAVPNLISIAGLHVKPPKPLPQDLQKFLDNSKNGAIVFTLGSNLKSADMGKERIEMFVNAFSKMKENIIWKFEGDLPNKPKNVIIQDWLPQSDILAHPNIKLFITHGGLLGTTESIDRGVPIVGIPIFGDQPMNTQQSVNVGVGLKLDFDSLSSDNIYNTVREVIDNPKYRNSAQARSRQFRDRPRPPMDEAIYWIEYVIRHKGAHHLRSAKQDLAWYQAEQLDVIAVLLIIVLTAICVIKCTIKAIFKKLCSKKETVSQKKKKN